MTDEEIITEILRREGSEYTNRANDRGGPTKFGITQRSWTGYFSTHTGQLPIQVKDLTEAQARQFYRDEYIGPLAWIVDDEIKGLAVDCAVNHGLGRAVMWLQEIVGTPIDGKIGPRTRAAINGTVPDVDYTPAYRKIYRDLLRKRFKFYAEIVTDQRNDPDLPNLRGWINRACEFIR